MKKQGQIRIIEDHLKDAKEIFTSYLKTLLINENKKFFDLEDSDEIKAFNISYSHEDLGVCCQLWNIDMEACEEKEEISFFQELYNESMSLDADSKFIPKALQKIEVELEVFEVFERWIIECWKIAKPRNFPLSGFLNEEDSKYFTNLDSGEKGDHTFVRDTIVPKAIEEEVPTESGYSIIENRSGKFGLRNPEGKMVTEHIYDHLAEFSNGLALVALNDKCGFIDKTGTVIIPLTYDYDWFCNGRFSDGLTAVSLNSKWGFIDAHNQTIIPFIYDLVGEFNGGIANVQLGKKWGYVNVKNETEIDFMFDNFSYPFQGEIAKVNYNGEYKFINRNGEFVDGKR